MLPSVLSSPLEDLALTQFVLCNTLADMFRASLQRALLLLCVLLGQLTLLVSGLGSSCSAPLTSGDSAANAPFWLQNITHRGTSAFNSNPTGYQVFRNVKVGIFVIYCLCL